MKNYFREELDYEPEPTDYVLYEFFGRRKFECLNRFALYRMWGELMRDCKLKRIKFTPYHLQRFYITQSILNGIDLMLILRRTAEIVLIQLLRITSTYKWKLKLKILLREGMLEKKWRMKKNCCSNHSQCNQPTYQKINSLLIASF